MPTIAQSYMPRLRDLFAKHAWEAATNKRTGELAMTDIKPTLLRMRNFLMNPVLTNIVGQAADDARLHDAGCGKARSS